MLCVPSRARIGHITCGNYSGIVHLLELDACTIDGCSVFNATFSQAIYNIYYSVEVTGSNSAASPLSCLVVKNITAFLMLVL